MKPLQLTRMHHDPIDQTYDNTVRQLMSLRVEGGYWEGKLSASALSTATSVCSLELVRQARRGEFATENADLDRLIQRGFSWLVQNQNDDGGWGDTAQSPSNISTTVLCWAAINLAGNTDVDVAKANQNAERWITKRAGDLTAFSIGRAIDAVYGKDRTFSIPILTMCALSGRFGDGRGAWTCIKPLPFELAALPHQVFKWMGLPVVSYALPALIAIGQACHFHRPSRNPVARAVRTIARQKTLRVLQSIQPGSGGFLEAAPLTGFVLMSLASIGCAGTVTAQNAARFLVESVRPDGSWPIDTNLATWVTTLSIAAFAADKQVFKKVVPREDRAGLLDYLLNQQYQTEHPYTHAAPGGWAWTHLTGGVPDGDDTPAALLAIRSLRSADLENQITTERLTLAAKRGARWLIDLQNKDGGIPTFCRGWGKLPFDQSSPDLTAHTLRAWSAWQCDFSAALRRSIDRAATRAVRFLLTAQRPDGSWIPLWFGNQHTPDQTNPLYGTSRVIRAAGIALADGPFAQEWSNACRRGADWIVASQNKDGGWGGDTNAPSSIEETALAVEALAEWWNAPEPSSDRSFDAAIERGCNYLAIRTQQGTSFDASPIGLYFAKLWYDEKLYPVIFTASALAWAKEYR